MPVWLESLGGSGMTWNTRKTCASLCVREKKRGRLALRAPSSWAGSTTALGLTIRTSLHCFLRERERRV